MIDVLSLEFIAKVLRAAHEPRKDVGVSEIGVTGQLEIRWLPLYGYAMDLPRWRSGV